MNFIAQTIRGRSGARYKIVSKLGEPGGQGQCYLAECKNNNLCVIKIFHATLDRDVVRKRTAYLIALELRSVSPIFVAPVDLIDENGRIGHMAPYFVGHQLETLIQGGAPPTLLAMLQLAIAIATAYCKLEEIARITHTDTSALNVLVRYDGDVILVGLIDLDNFRSLDHRRIPPPLSPGQYPYLAPEQVESLHREIVVPVDSSTERYALAVLIHEIILLRHPQHSALCNPKQFAETVRRGMWLGDPMRGNASKGCGGYPPSILNTELSTLFREALGHQIDRRPSARCWLTALLKAADLVRLCPACNGPNIVDSSKQACPHCLHPYPVLAIRLPNGRRIPIISSSRPVGRNELGPHPSISNLHLVLQRIGPDSFVHCRGSQGTFRLGPRGWDRLPREEAVQVEAGQRLRVSESVELEVVPVDGATLIRTKGS